MFARLGDEPRTSCFRFFLLGLRARARDPRGLAHDVVCRFRREFFREAASSAIESLRARARALPRAFFIGLAPCRDERNAANPKNSRANSPYDKLANVFRARLLSSFFPAGVFSPPCGKKPSSFRFHSNQNRTIPVSILSPFPPLSPPRLFFSPAGDILCLFLREEMAGEVIKRARVRV